jgi:hypothetical protein
MTLSLVGLAATEVPRVGYHERASCGAIAADSPVAARIVAYLIRSSFEHHSKAMEATDNLSQSKSKSWLTAEEFRVLDQPRPRAMAEASTSKLSVAAVPSPAEPQQTMNTNECPMPAEIVYSLYSGEHEIPAIMRLCEDELSEPYSVFTVRFSRRVLSVNSSRRSTGTF